MKYECFYTQSGQTALMKSSFRGHINVVKVLVEKQALIDIRCKVNIISQARIRIV